MKITWVLPQNYDIPIGGYKIVYQYANQLISMGHQVRIVFLKDPRDNKKNILFKIVRYFYWSLFHKNPFKKDVTWFSLDSKIKTEWNISKKSLWFDKQEKVIATAYWTAKIVSDADIPTGNKFYFLQDYELFSGTKEEVDESWKLPLNKFSVSSWLAQFGKNKFGENIKFIPNFLDEADDFKVTNSLSNRTHTIALLNHSNKRKNTKLGLEVISMIHRYVPDVKVKLFGTQDFNDPEFDYVDYFKQPSRKCLRDEIYNQSLIYLLPSEYEGWGLTAMEAMASGDIVISNDNGGVNDFINNGINGFIIDFNDKEAVVNKILEIFNGNKYDNAELAINASKITEKFSVSESSIELINFLDRIK